MNYSDAGKKGYAKTQKAIEAHREQQQNEARLRYEANAKVCPTCNDVLPYEKRDQKFCDHSCAAAYYSGGIPSKKVEAKPCAFCGNPVEKHHNKYCDDCIKNAVYNKAQSLDGMKSDRGRRHFLIRERGHQCEGCSNSEWRGIPIALELDHIDGNPDNNTAENLRLLCPNCHAQTEFYKGAAATKGKGRHSIRRQKRRERYENGDSY